MTTSRQRVPPALRRSCIHLYHSPRRQAGSAVKEETEITVYLGRRTRQNFQRPFTLNNPGEIWSGMCLAVGLQYASPVCWVY